MPAIDSREGAWLLDGNVLVALAIVEHEHHRRAMRWLQGARNSGFATCSVTEGTLLRVFVQMRSKIDAAAPPLSAAWEALQALRAHPGHIFINDGFSYMEVRHEGLAGHREITDAWLAELARRHQCAVATLDEAFAAKYPDTVVCLPNQD